MKKDFIYLSRTRYALKDGVRQAFVAGFEEPFLHGLHGAQREYYGAPPDKPEGPSTLDHFVAAAGACMYATLKSALVARKIPVDDDSLHGEAVGRIVDDGGVLRIAEIAMHYRLRVPADRRAAADRALEAHPRGCPIHQSIGSAVPIRWEADVEELEPVTPGGAGEAGGPES